MKTKTQKLLERLFRLQSDIYDLQSVMEDRNRTQTAELVGSAGFELDAAMKLLKEAIKTL